MNKILLILSFLVLIAAGLCWPSFQNPCSWGRRFAVSRSTDEVALAEAAVKDIDAGIRAAAAAKVTAAGPLARVAREAKDEKLRLDATGRTADQAVLKQVALHDAMPTVRRAAIERLTDQEALSEAAVKDTSAPVRRVALGRLIDQGTLAAVAAQDSDAGVREAAVQRLRLSPQADSDLLARVTMVAGNEKVRRAAATVVQLKLDERVREKAAQFAQWQAANPNWTGSDLVAHLAVATGIKLVRIEPGEFTMGSANGDSDEKPQHQVIISRPFFLGATELTQAQWSALMGSNPSARKGDTLPVERVAYADALEFCKKLTERERAAARLPAAWAFTLPTEAQWEYACRAGTTGDYAGDLDAMAWYDKQSASTTHSAGTMQANAWGLFDMHGNVWEWCLDWYGSYPRGDVTDPEGPSGSRRVNRGGGWRDSADGCRSAAREGDAPGYRRKDLGFRLALSFSP